MSTTPRLYSAQGMPADAAPGRFRTLQYQPTPSEHWYHVLFGHVPRFQMDFILRPELPCRKFRPQHFAHLGPQIKFLSPAAGHKYALAIGNLSSNDTQHVAGRGGISLIVSTRVADLRDHAQRESPVFAHGLIAIDEPLEAAQLARSAQSFVDRVLDDGLRFYHGYYSSGQADNFERVYGYIRSLRELPAPDGADAAGVGCYSSEEPPPYNQILIDCRGLDDRLVVQLAARLGVILYRTNLKWSAVTTGVEEFEPKLYQGEDYSIAVRLICGAVSTDEMERQMRSVCAGSRAGLFGFAELATADRELGSQLFGLPGPARAERKRAAASVSFSLAGQAPGSELKAGERAAVWDEEPPLLSKLAAADAVPAEPLAAPPPASKPLSLESASVRPAGQPVRAPNENSRFLPLVACGLAGLLVGAFGTLWLLQRRAVPAAALQKRALPSRAAAPASEPRADAPERSAEAGGVPATGAANLDDSQLELRLFLVSGLRQKIEPVASYADATYQRASRMLEERPSAPWKKLRDGSERLKSQLDKMDHIAAALSEPGSVHGVGTLIENYCKVLSAQEQVKQIEREYQFGEGPYPATGSGLHR